MLNMKINIFAKEVLLTFVQYSSATLESISLSLYTDMEDPAEVVVNHALVDLIGDEEDKVTKKVVDFMEGVVDKGKEQVAMEVTLTNCPSPLLGAIVLIGMKYELAC